MEGRQFSCGLCHTADVCVLCLLPCLHLCCVDCLRKVLHGESSIKRDLPSQCTTEIKDTSIASSTQKSATISIKSVQNDAENQSMELSNSENRTSKSLQNCASMRSDSPSLTSTSNKLFSCTKCSYKVLLNEVNLNGLKRLTSFLFPSVDHSSDVESIILQAEKPDVIGETIHHDAKSCDTAEKLSMNYRDQDNSATFNVHCNICNVLLNYTIDSDQSASSSDSMFCATCDVPLCKNCLSINSHPQEAGHREHTVCSLDDILKGRRRYISSLIGQGKVCLERQGNRLSQLNSAGSHLNETRHQLLRLLDHRAMELCCLVLARRDALAQELIREHGVCEAQYVRGTESCHALYKNLNDALMLTGVVFPQISPQSDKNIVPASCKSNNTSPHYVHNLLSLHSDVSTRLNHLINSSSANDSSGLDVMSLQLSVHGASSGRWDFLNAEHDSTGSNNERWDFIEAGNGNISRSTESNSGEFCRSNNSSGSDTYSSGTVEYFDDKLVEMRCNSVVKSIVGRVKVDDNPKRPSVENGCKLTENAIQNSSSNQSNQTKNSLVLKIPCTAAIGSNKESSEMARGSAHPDDVLAVEKLFGSLVRGAVSCGGPRRIASHSVDVTWPVALVITRSHDFVVAGKTGAFASEGKLLFSDRQGNPISTHHYERSRLPISMVATNNGRVLVSDTSGNICKFSSCGRLLDEWSKKFQIGRHSQESGKQSLSVGTEYKPKNISMEKQAACNQEELKDSSVKKPDADAKREPKKIWMDKPDVDLVRKQNFSDETISAKDKRVVGVSLLCSGDGECIAGSQSGSIDKHGRVEHGQGDGVGGFSGRIGSIGSSSCSSSGGSILGGQMALAPDGQVWVTSGCGRLLKYSTVDGQQMGSLRLWQWSIISTAADGHVRATGHLAATGHSVATEKRSDGHQITNESGQCQKNLISEGQTEGKDALHFSQNSQLPQNSSVDEIEDMVEKDGKIANDNKELNRKDSNLIKLDLNLDINALAVDSNGCFVVSVLDRKAVYMFTPSGELSASYPTSLVRLGYTKTHSQETKSAVEGTTTTKVTTPKVTSEIADGWEMVEDGCSTETSNSEGDTICNSSGRGDGTVVTPEVETTESSNKISLADAGVIGKNDCDTDRKTTQSKVGKDMSPNSISSHCDIDNPAIYCASTSADNCNPDSASVKNDNISMKYNSSVSKKNDEDFSQNEKSQDDNTVITNQDNLSEQSQCLPNRRGENCDNLCDISVPSSAAAIELKCPTAVCCDPFGNVLVADFTADCIHLVSPSGRFLGHFVTSANGVSCPNFVSLNADASQLYIGQYGGEVLVYQYLSYVKRA